MITHYLLIIARGNDYDSSRVFVEAVIIKCRPPVF